MPVKSNLLANRGTVRYVRYCTGSPAEPVRIRWSWAALRSKFIIEVPRHIFIQSKQLTKMPEHYIRLFSDFAEVRERSMREEVIRFQLNTFFQYDGCLVESFQRNQATANLPVNFAAGGTLRDLLPSRQCFGKAFTP